MSREEFFAGLYAAEEKCIVIDDEQINPVEIVILTENRPRLENKLGFSKHIFVEQGEKKRLVVIRSFDEFGLGRWKNNLYRNALKDQSAVYLLREEDFAAICLYYVFVLSKRACWLSANIVHTVAARLNITDQFHEKLREWFSGYLDKYGYSDTKSSQLITKIRHRLPLECIRVESFFHTLLRNPRYIKGLEKNELRGKKWVLLKKKAGSSGAVLIKSETDNGTEFIKGNGLSVYNGVKNEIIAQIQLSKNLCEQPWFLPMLRYDSDMRWISYPFAEQCSLDEVLNKRVLSKGDLEKLGQFMVYALDQLAGNEIVHNDLRGDNIVVLMDEKDEIVGFCLTDFGCASCRGSQPWRIQTYLGRYVAHMVCGDYRYNASVIDDAATAYLVYLEAGGSRDDRYAKLILDRIGRIYYFC